MAKVVSNFWIAVEPNTAPDDCEHVSILRHIAGLEEDLADGSV